MKDTYFPLLNKKAFLLMGKVEKLLKGITINTLDQPVNAFINQFGKVEVLFAQQFVNGHAYLVFEKQFEERLKGFLEKYLRLARATMSDSELNVYHVLGEVNEKYGICILQRWGFLVLAQEAPPLDEMSDEEYTVLRVENNCSVQGIDFDQELILNTNWKDVASLTKGCYLGQEVVARVSNLGKPPKKMIRVVMSEKKEKIIVGGKEVAVTSVCYSEQRRKWMGFCLVTNEDALKDWMGF